MKGDHVWVERVHHETRRDQPVEPPFWVCPRCESTQPGYVCANGWRKQRHQGYPGEEFSPTWRCPQCTTEYKARGHEHLIWPNKVGCEIVIEGEQRIGSRMDLLFGIEPPEETGPTQTEIEAALEELWGEPETPVVEVVEEYTQERILALEMERLQNQLRHRLGYDVEILPAPDGQTGIWVRVLRAVTPEEQAQILRAAPMRFYSGIFTSRRHSNADSDNNILHYVFDTPQEAEPLS